MMHDENHLMLRKLQPYYQFPNILHYWLKLTISDLLLSLLPSLGVSSHLHWVCIDGYCPHLLKYNQSAHLLSHYAEVEVLDMFGICVCVYDKTRSPILAI